MPSFIQPNSLENALSSSNATFKYAYDNASATKCLFSDCKSLEPGKIYVSKDHPTATVSTFGCWFPKVNHQTELNNNYVLLTAANYSTYYFFRLNDEGLYELCMTTTLSTGFANGTPVEISGHPGEVMLSTEFAKAHLNVVDDDGPVIIVGIIDVGSPEE